jgi:iron complex outermembrane receptor protein
MKSRTGLSVGLFLWFLLIGVYFPNSRTYADPAADDASASGSDELAEIVVTAQRRSENLEKTPVAVSVLSSDLLAQKDIVTQSDLQVNVPGLTVRAGLNSNVLNYSIRGQTVDTFSGSQPAVLPYINEVEVGGLGGETSFYDLDSIQVLKGPQGTLFGKNTTGGAVLLTTAKPGDTFGGYFSASTGNYGLTQFEGAVNLPINDAIQARIAGFYESRDGFQYNTFTGRRDGDVDRDGVRGSLRIKFSENVKTDLVVEYMHAGGSSVNLVVNYVSPQFSNNAAAPANLLYTAYLDTLLHFPGAFAIFSAGNPKIPPGGIYAFLALQNARGPYVISDNNDDLHKANNLVTSDLTTVDITDDLQFRNIAGFNLLRSSDGDDADGTPYGISGTPTGVPYGIFISQEQFSEEPQLLGKAFGGNLSYVTGLYISSDRTPDYDLTSLVDLRPLAPPIAQNNDTDIRDKSYAAYAQGTYDLGSSTGVNGLSATLGFRYTHEDVSMAQLPGSVYYNPAPPLENYLSKTFNKPSWQAGLQEQVDPNWLLYVVSRRSFRSGGFNLGTPPIPGFGTAGGAGFNAETATDVELGSKFQGDLLGLPARLNVALYNQWVVNGQREAFSAFPGGFLGDITVNVPKSIVRGIEVDSEVDPISWLRLGTNFTYIDAKFTENVVTLVGPPVVPVSFGPYPDTPRWSGLVYGEVHDHLTSRLEWSLRAEVYDETNTFYSSTNSTITQGGTELPSYTLTNFRLGLQDTKAGWSVAGLVKNAFNRVYYVGGFGASNVNTINAVVPGDPRTFVVTLRYNF